MRGGWAVEGSGRRLDTSRCCTSLASNPAALSRVAGPAARLSRYKRCRLLPLVPGAWLFATVGVDMSATLPVNAASSAAAFQVRLPKAANNVRCDAVQTHDGEEEERGLGKPTPPSEYTTPMLCRKMRCRSVASVGVEHVPERRVTKRSGARGEERKAARAVTACKA